MKRRRIAPGLWEFNIRGLKHYIMYTGDAYKDYLVRSPDFTCVYGTLKAALHHLKCNEACWAMCIRPLRSANK